MIDLHIHSNYSDGSESVVEILKQAEKLKLSTISITDHEKCGAYKELEQIDVKRYYSGNIIRGIELKSQYNDGIIDVLGYNIDCDKMREFLDECYQETGREKIEEKKLEEFYKYGIEYGLTLKPIEELEWNKKKDWGSLVFYNEMKSHEENRKKVPEELWESFKNFKQNYYKVKGKMFYINVSKYYPTLEKIIEMIHKSGGVAFIAHIYEYTWLKNKIQELDSIKEKIDGVECYHSSFSEEQIAILIKYCRENDLLMSGGSDYHGTNKPDIKLGVGKGNLQISDKILKNKYWERIVNPTSNKNLKQEIEFEL